MPPLVAQAARVRVVTIDVHFNTVGTIQSDGLHFAIWKPHGKTITIAPVRGDEDTPGEFS